MRGVERVDDNRRGGAPLIGSGLAVLLAIASVGSTPACASSQAADMAVMQTELARVQKEADTLAERVGHLEEHGDHSDPATVSPTPAAPSPPASAPSPVHADASPPLRVVKLGPATIDGADSSPPSPASTAIGDTDDDAPRPVLRVGPGGMEQTYPDDPTPGSKSTKSKAPSIDPKATADYDAAIALVKAHKPQAALDAFAGFLVRYPDHPYVGNAIYWRGECYFALGDYVSAASQLEGLLARLPGSNKVPDALLKLGMSYRKLGSAAKARAAFDRLRKEYPLTEAAKKIPPEDAS